MDNVTSEVNRVNLLSLTDPSASIIISYSILFNTIQYYSIISYSILIRLYLFVRIITIVGFWITLRFRVQMHDFLKLNLNFNKYFHAKTRVKKLTTRRKKQRYLKLSWAVFKDTETQD